jgi:hypothetical protein
MIEKVRSIAMWHVSFVRIAAWDEDCAAYNGGMHMRQVPPI